MRPLPVRAPPRRGPVIVRARAALPPPGAIGEYEARKVMPNYDFSCPGCGHDFEENLLISERDREDVVCPSCGRVGARRQVSAPNIGGRSGAGGGGFSRMPVPT